MLIAAASPHPDAMPASAISDAVRQRVKTQVNVTPSPKAIVNSGDFSYFSDKGMNPLPYALSEFIDNSLSAINLRMASEEEADQIPGEIRLSFDKSGNTSAVIIWDNGCGMNLDTLEKFAVFALSPEDREEMKGNVVKKNSKEMSGEFYSNPLRINTDISMFGVGAKMSAFFIGQDLTMVTKCKGSDEVLEYRCNSSEMISEYKTDGIQCYSKTINHRAPGQYNSSELATESAILPRLKQYMEELEMQHDSFTYAVISGVKKDFMARFENHSRDTAFSLAEVYHWYLHGHPTIPTGIGGKISISIGVGGQPTLDLKSIPSPEKEQISRKKDTFSFELVDHENKSIAIFGFIDYFPFDDVETVPEQAKIFEDWTGTVPVQQESDEEDDENDGVEIQQSLPPVFSCWWQGRLIPMTMVDSLKWMTGAFKPNSRSRFRIRGHLFFNRNFKVTQNKSTFTEDLRAILDKPSVVAQPCHSDNGPLQKATRTSKNMEESFKDWIKKCHDQYDKEVQFRRKRSLKNHERWRSWLEYEEMIVNTSMFKSGDNFHLKSYSNSRRPRFGRIVKFLMQNPNSADDFETHPDSVFVSGSDRGLKCEYLPLPEFCFPEDRDKKHYVKLRTIDKAMSFEEVEMQLSRLTTEQLKQVPARLDVLIYDPGVIPAKVFAGYKFPNADCELKSESGDSLLYVPFEGTKRLKVRQRFFIENQNRKEELKCSEGVSKDGRFSFWEIDTLFRRKGTYTAEFDVLNYCNPNPSLSLSRSFRFEVIPAQPASLQISKNASSTLSIVMGGSSKGQISAKFLDEFGNVCPPDVAFLANVVLSHDKLLLRVSPLKTSKDDIIFANIYAEPKIRDGTNRFISFDRSEITSLDVGIKGRAIAVGTINVTMALAEPCAMAWASHPDQALHVVSGRTLPTFAIQLLDRYGLHAHADNSIKSLTIALTDPNAKLNGVVGKVVKVTNAQFSSGGLVWVPSLQINSGLEKVGLRASLIINKPKHAGHPIVLERDIIVVPGNMLGNAIIRIVGIRDDPPTVIAGSTHSLHLELSGENRQPWPKPYSDQITERYAVECDGEIKHFDANGMLKDAMTFPQKIRQSLYKFTVLVKDIGDDSLSVPLSYALSVRLIPDAGVEWRAVVTRPIRCGEPIGDAIQITFHDKFGNNARISSSSNPKISFGGRCSLGGDITPRLIKEATCLTYPGIVLNANGPGYSVIINGQVLAKFEISEGRPCSLSVKVSGDPRIFKQLDTNEPLSIDIPVLSHGKRTFDVQALDASGAVVSVAPSIRVLCKEASVTPVQSTVSFGKSFMIAFNVPAHQDTILITFAGDQIPKPFVCAFPVQPWLLGVQTVNLDPIVPAVVAGAPIPTISGHVLNGAGAPLPLEQVVLSSLFLSFTNTETKRDIAREHFCSAVDQNGAFSFASRDSVTIAGSYTVSVTYVEKRPDALEILDKSKATLSSQVASLKILPGKASRLHLSDPALPIGSVTAPPLSKILYLNVHDDFGNPVPFQFTDADAKELMVKIVHQNNSYICRPQLSIDPNGQMILKDLRIGRPDRLPPLPNGTYTLCFKVNAHPQLAQCSLEFFHSYDASASTQVLDLATQERQISEKLNALREDLNRAKESSSITADKLKSCQEFSRAIVHRHFSPDQNVSVDQVLHRSIIERDSLRARIAQEHRPMAVGTGAHQNLQNMKNFIGIIGSLVTCSNADDCRLASFALGDKVSCPIFRSIGEKESARLNMRHFALDVMSARDPPSLSRHQQMYNQLPEKPWDSDPVTLFSLLHPDPNIARQEFSSVFSSLVGLTIVAKTYHDAMAFKRFCTKHKLPCGNVYSHDGRIVAQNGELGRTIPPLDRMVLRIGIEPKQLRDQLTACEKRIDDLEKFVRSSQDEQQLLQQQVAASEKVTSIKQVIMEQELVIKRIHQQIDATDPTASQSRKRRKSSFGGPDKQRQRTRL